MIEDQECLQPAERQLFDESLESDTKQGHFPIPLFQNQNQDVKFATPLPTDMFNLAASMPFQPPLNYVEPPDLRLERKDLFEIKTEPEQLPTVVSQLSPNNQIYQKQLAIILELEELRKQGRVDEQVVRSQ